VRAGRRLKESMRRNARVVLVALSLTIIGITVVLIERAENPAAIEAAPEASEGQVRTRVFWEHYRTATRLRVAERPVEAAAAYLAALEIDADHEDALYYLGNTELELGRFVDAEQTWRRLVEVNPSSARGHARLGELLFCIDGAGLRDLKRAEAAFLSALEINREQTGPLLRLGQIALADRRYSLAARYFDAVIGTNSGSYEAHYSKGFVAWKSGDSAAAAELFARALEHARPDGNADPLIGEGDTADGSRPLLAEKMGCPALQPHVDALRGPSAPPPMDASYRALDATLARLGAPVSSAP
jgi:tetratricopeptide (TPR) repeat protein